MSTRPLILALLAVAALVAPIGLALSVASPGPRPPSPPPRSFDMLTGVADFPNCPAPAVNRVSIRATTTANGPALAIFVVVQNIGNRAFYAAPGAATLVVTQGEKVLGSFALERLSASEVKFFSVLGTLAPQAEDVAAAIRFAPTVPVGRVAGTLDCRIGDNHLRRDGGSIRAALEREAG
ncbi:hypothetical protein [Labrys wisconsinensis]|uniref:Uncharacterized protein n=1 Tax=Labrys wisconsinensis TaxID=425677 RepID=A0ABU0J4C9_9HYPH|nr:hypothetical protein [Labrys wisconsinensis]MDQ0468134.1 hypothetical protein [Labrys wisconsinensis]